MHSSEYPRRLIGALIATVLLVLAAACTSSKAPGPPAPSIGQTMDAQLPAAVTNMPLIASNGQRLTLASLAGEVVVISDFMTLCQETCPLDTANVVAAARAVHAAGLSDKVAFLSITIDPARDTRARLAAYRRLYGAVPANWFVLTGTRHDLTVLWKTLGVYIKKVPDTTPAPTDWLTGKPLSYDLTHSDEVFFLDGTGRERFLLDGAPHVAPGAPIPTALRRFMDAKGEKNLTHPDPIAWTLPQAVQVLSWLIGQDVPT